MANWSIEGHFSALEQSGMKPYAQVRWHTEMVGQLPRLLSVLFGGLWGFLFVVMIGLVDQSGELVKAFVPVLTALTGAGQRRDCVRPWHRRE